MAKNKYSEEEYREAAKIWRKENPTYERIPDRTIITISNGKEINVGKRMSAMRQNPEKLTEEQREFWKEYGLFATNQALKDKYSEEEYKEAANIWKKENPTIEMIPVKTNITISNGKEIPIGKRMRTMRQNPERLTKEQQNFWSNYGLFATSQASKDKYSEEEYRQAARIWKKENPTIEIMPERAIVTISNGKEIPVGSRMRTMRQNPEKLTEDQKKFWTDYGLFATNRASKTKYSEEEYRQAARIWKKENPTVEKIPNSVIITISNGKEISVGSRMSAMRQNPEKLTEEQREFWTDYGLFATNQETKDKYSEEEYRQAAKIWRKENPTVKMIPKSTVITISNGKKIPIGERMRTMRQNPERLIKEQKDFWTDYGLFTPKQSLKNKYSEEEYRQAARIWRKENPTIEMIPVKTTITISNGKEITIGPRMNTMRQNPEKLTEEQKEFWKEYGLFATNQAPKDKYSEEEYRQAAIIWRKENPTIEMIPAKTTITISNGKEIPIGKRMSKMRQGLEKLTKEQKEFWKDYGIFATNQASKDKYSEEEYRQAAIIWRKENPADETIQQRAVVTISNGKKIYIGSRMSKMRRYPEKLTEEQKGFWKDYGLYWTKENSDKKQTTLEKYIEQFNGDEEKAKRVVQTLKNIREKRKSKKKEEWNIDNILKEFDVDIEKLMSYLNKTKAQGTKRAKTLEYQGKTLKEFCIENSFNYDVVSRAVRLHEIGIHGNLEELINRELVNYQKHGQKEAATWIYEKYGNIVKHVLLYLNLDSSSIIKEMTSYQITLEEAIRHEVFKHTKEKQENNWLEELYEYLIDEVQENKSKEQTIDDLANMFAILITEYHLTKEEANILWNSFSRYIKTIKQYQLVDVGLETNEKIRLEKIKDYKLEPEDIEESFFIPLEFDKNVLLGRKSELYQRRVLLRQYIIDWDYYTELEKQEIIIKNKFTKEEINQIEKTRTKINETIELTEDKRL